MAAAERRQTAQTERPESDLDRKLLALSEEQRQLYQQLSQIPAPAALYRDRGKILLTNRPLDELFGYGPGELWGQLSDLLFYRLPDRRELRKRLASEFPVAAFEAEGKRIDGTLFAMQAWVGRTVCGGWECALAILVDITAHRVALANETAKRKTVEKLLDYSEHDRDLISCELHDGMAQDVTAALMHLEAAARDLKKGKREAVVDLETVARLLREGLAETRRLIDRVRPPDLDRFGLVGAVQLLVQRKAELCGIPIDFHHDVPVIRLAPQLETGVYRMIQEALNNVRKHSRAAKALVALTERDGNLQVFVRDWGVGFQPPQASAKHFGLASIRHRARLLNGSARIESTPGQGTIVYIEVPCQIGERDR